jgi:hypothetical protein
MKNLNWLGLLTLIIGCGCFGLIGFKRSAWWGPAKSLLDELDLTEIRFVKIGSISLFASIVFLAIANL